MDDREPRSPASMRASVAHLHGVAPSAPGRRSSLVLPDLACSPVARDGVIDKPLKVIANSRRLNSQWIERGANVRRVETCPQCEVGPVHLSLLHLLSSFSSHDQVQN